MPNRILRDGILTSERVNSLSTDGELFYRRLMSVVDDHGRYYANPVTLLAHCYPLKVEEKSSDEVLRLMHEVAQVGLLTTYNVKGTAYLELHEFRQRKRSPSKFPDAIHADNDGHVTDKRPSNGGHMSALDVGVVGVVGISKINPEFSKSSQTHTADKNRKRFTKPTLPEIREYVESIGAAVNPSSFFNHYEANGWKVGKNAMKDWKAAVRSWGARDRP